ncbi:MAG: hypothetical protein LBF24_01515 [Puniceicoccales bacterium]|nr:hypothetical protein [Puniceicoccales bacterium]
MDLLHDLPSRIVKMAPIVAVFDALSAPVIEVNPMVAASLGGDLANVKNLFELIALVDSAIFEDRMADFSSVTFNGNTDDMFELVNAVNDYAVAAFWLASGTKLFVAPSEENAPDAEAVKSFADLFHSELDRQKASLKARYARNWYEAKLSQQLCAALPAMAELFDVASDTCVAKNSVASADCSAPGGKVAKSLARVIQSNGFSSLVAMATAGGESDLVPECFAEQVAKEAVATLLRVASEKKNFIQGIGTFFIDGELPPKPKLVRGSTTANECLVCVREIAIFCNIVLVGNGETEGLAMRSTVNLTDPLSDVQLEAFQEFFECFHAHVGATIDEIRNSYAKARVDASALTVNGKTGTANMLASEAVSLFLETPDLNTDASLLKVEYDDLVVAKAVELAAIKARNESALPKRRFQRTFRLRIE